MLPTNNTDLEKFPLSEDETWEIMGDVLEAVDECILSFISRTNIRLDVDLTILNNEKQRYFTVEVTFSQNAGKAYDISWKITKEYASFKEYHKNLLTPKI